jgi:hypothetical protein
LSKLLHKQQKKQASQSILAGVITWEQDKFREGMTAHTKKTIFSAFELSGNALLKTHPRHYNL